MPPKVLKKWGWWILPGSRRLGHLVLILGRRADHHMIFHIFSIPFLPWVFHRRLFKVLRKKNEIHCTKIHFGCDFLINPFIAKDIQSSAFMLLSRRVVLEGYSFTDMYFKGRCFCANFQSLIDIVVIYIISAACDCEWLICIQLSSLRCWWRTMLHDNSLLK